VAPGRWPTFWNGNVKAITGIARIDNAPYLFFGAPGGIGPAMTQTQVEITPTQSRYEFTAAGVTLYLTFISSEDTNDLRLLSMPWADYLVPNTLNPEFQNQTDDFTGRIAHSSNLANAF
jgi:Domain of unknown function (DUF4965)